MYLDILTTCHGDLVPVQPLPVIPTGTAKFSRYAVLKFLDVRDARYFEYILHQRKQTDVTMSEVRTIRWTITSSQLSAGKNDYVQAIQNQIVDYYNNKIVAKLNNYALML